MLRDARLTGSIACQNISAILTIREDFLFGVRLRLLGALAFSSPDDDRWAGRLEREVERCESAVTEQWAGWFEEEWNALARTAQQPLNKVGERLRDAEFVERRRIRCTRARQIVTILLANRGMGWAELVTTCRIIDPAPSRRDDGSASIAEPDILLAACRDDVGTLVLPREGVDRTGAMRIVSDTFEEQLDRWSRVLDALPITPQVREAVASLLFEATSLHLPALWTRKTDGRPIGFCTPVRAIVALDGLGSAVLESGNEDISFVDRDGRFYGAQPTASFAQAMFAARRIGLETVINRNWKGLAVQLPSGAFAPEAIHSASVVLSIRPMIQVMTGLKLNPLLLLEDSSATLPVALGVFGCLAHGRPPRSVFSTGSFGAVESSDVIQRRVDGVPVGLARNVPVRWPNGAVRGTDLIAKIRAADCTGVLGAFLAPSQRPSVRSLLAEQSRTFAGVAVSVGRFSEALAHSFPLPGRKHRTLGVPENEVLFRHPPLPADAQRVFPRAYTAISTAWDRCESPVLRLERDRYSGTSTCCAAWLNERLLAMHGVNLVRPTIVAVRALSAPDAREPGLGWQRPFHHRVDVRIWPAAAIEDQSWRLVLDALWADAMHVERFFGTTDATKRADLVVDLIGAQDVELLFLDAFGPLVRDGRYTAALLNKLQRRLAPRDPASRYSPYFGMPRVVVECGTTVAIERGHANLRWGDDPAKGELATVTTMILATSGGWFGADEVATLVMSLQSLWGAAAPALSAHEFVRRLESLGLVGQFEGRHYFVEAHRRVWVERALVLANTLGTTFDPSNVPNKIVEWAEHIGLGYLSDMPSRHLHLERAADASASSRALALCQLADQFAMIRTHVVEGSPTKTKNEKDDARAKRKEIRELVSVVSRTATIVSGAGLMRAYALVTTAQRVAGDRTTEFDLIWNILEGHFGGDPVETKGTHAPWTWQIVGVVCVAMEDAWTYAKTRRSKQGAGHAAIEEAERRIAAARYHLAGTFDRLDATLRQRWNAGRWTLDDERIGLWLRGMRLQHGGLRKRDLDALRTELDSLFEDVRRFIPRDGWHDPLGVNCYREIGDVLWTRASGIFRKRDRRPWEERTAEGLRNAAIDTWMRGAEFVWRAPHRPEPEHLLMRLVCARVFLDPGARFHEIERDIQGFGGDLLRRSVSDFGPVRFMPPELAQVFITAQAAMA